MRQQDIVIGGRYRVRIGGRLAPVEVISQRRRSGYGGRVQTVFVCVTQDTHRQIEASAARLRPVPGTIGAELEAERRAANAGKRTGPRPFVGPAGEATVDAAAVPGILSRVGPTPVSALSEPNRDTIRRIVDSVHVAEPFPAVARRVRSRIGAQVLWQTIPRALRRGILFAAAQRHAEGRRLYRIVMRHDPLPSESMVADAIGRAVGLGPMPRG